MTPIRLFIRSVQREFAVNDGFVTTIRRKTEHAAAGQPESRPESLEARVKAQVKSQVKSRVKSPDCCWFAMVR